MKPGLGPVPQEIVAAMVGHNAPGALPCGTRVRKARSEPEDIVPTGTAGTVTGSAGPMEDGPDVAPHLVGTYAYAVCWENGINTFVIGDKLGIGD